MANIKNLLSKKVLIIVIPVIAVLVIVLAFIIPWPSSSQVAGTMGDEEGIKKAKKYRTSQMSEADVILKNPEYQNLLQSDEFQKLLKNDEFVKLVSGGNFYELAQKGFISLAGEANFIALLKNEDFNRLFSNSTFNAIASNEAFQSIIFTKEVNNIIAKGDFDKLQSNSAFNNFIQSKEFASMNVSYSEIITLFKSDVYKNAVLNKEFQYCMGNNVFGYFLKSGDLNAFPSPDVLQNLCDVGMVFLCKQESFGVILKSPEFQNMARNGSLDLLLGKQ